MQCMPVFGTGGGGATLEVLRHLLPAVYLAVNECNVDVAIVTNEPSVFAAVQLERKRLEVKWPLADHHLQSAAFLADSAMAGELVLFLGSGVSAGCGLSTWGTLLDDLAEEVGLGAQMPDAPVPHTPMVSPSSSAMAFSPLRGAEKPCMTRWENQIQLPTTRACADVEPHALSYSCTHYT